MNQNHEGKKALIYSRVSTKEQASTGYSLDYQEDQLIKYCQEKGIQIIQSYKESHSAKSFDRPEFKRMYAFAISNSNQVDYILTVKWDRFSREVGNSDRMLVALKSAGILVNAIAEWRDLDKTSDWVMHKIQMTMAEAENKIKSERVRDGNYKAYSEGRYINKPPLGYISGRDELGKPLMKPDPLTAEMVTSLLLDYSTGNYSQNKLLQKYQALGLKITKSNLSRLLGKEIYAGLLTLKPYKDNPEQTIKALHVPLISESIFRKNQYFLEEKNRLKDKPKKDNESLPLRGKILKCPNCDRYLTGYIKIKPNGKEYPYYRCDNNLGCSFSCNANKANEQFVDKLKGIKPSKGVLELFERILIKKYESQNKTREKDVSLLKSRHTELVNKQDKLIDKYVDGKIDERAYRRFNDNLMADIHQVEEELAETPLKNEVLEKYLRFSKSFLGQLGDAYQNANVQTKKLILSSILSGNPVFDGEKYRTLPFKPIISLLSKYSKDFKKLDTKKGDNFSTVSRNVPGAGLEPARA